MDIIENVDKRLTSSVNVMLQCNTSGEENKGGFLDEEELLRAAEFVQNESNFMKLEGLMTIGSVENSKRAAEENVPNADFTRLRELRQKVSERLKISPEELSLSMGMSTDYLDAIEQGASVIRVGSKIFGARNYSK